MLKTKKPTMNTLGNEVHMLVLGKLAVGKSSLANAILGEEVFEVGISPQQGAICPKSHTRQYGSIKITVYDTHGLFDDGRMKENEILDAIQQTQPRQGYNFIIACIKIHDKLDHRNQAIFNVIGKLQESSEVQSNTIVAITFSDALPEIDKTKFNEEYREAIKVVATHTSLSIYNTTHIILAREKSILRNWLPLFLLDIFYRLASLTLQTVLSVLQAHPLTKSPIETAIQNLYGSGYLNRFRTWNTMIQDVAGRGDEGYRGICEELQKDMHL